MARPNKQDRLEAEAAPMTIEEFVHLDNQADREIPDELQRLQKHIPRYISTIKSGQRPNLRLEQVSGDRRNNWKLNMEEEFVLGRIGEEREAIKPPSEEERTINEAVTLEPHKPDWSGIAYHPKIAGSGVPSVTRRTKGKKITPHYIFGNEDRQVYYPNTYPWRCIGRVFVWINAANPIFMWSGTGALVGRNVVLTASHVCPWFSKLGLPWMMQFVPAYYDGTSLMGSGVSSFVQSYRGYQDHGQGDDMATLKLYTPLGDSLGYFGYKTYHDSWEGGCYWTKCGYPGAIASANRPSRVTWFPIIDDDNDGAGVELEYRADSSKGDSGGPVFSWWNGKPYVIGTHSGGEEEYHFPFSIVKNNVAAGGGALSSLISWARNNW